MSSATPPETVLVLRHGEVVTDPEGDDDPPLASTTSSSTFEDCCDAVCDALLLSGIATNERHLLRYLSAAAIISSPSKCCLQTAIGIRDELSSTKRKLEIMRRMRKAGSGSWVKPLPVTKRRDGQGDGKSESEEEDDDSIPLAIDCGLVAHSPGRLRGMSDDDPTAYPPPFAFAREMFSHSSANGESNDGGEEEIALHNDPLRDLPTPRETKQEALARLERTLDNYLFAGAAGFRHVILVAADDVIHKAAGDQQAAVAEPLGFILLMGRGKSDGPLPLSSSSSAPCCFNVVASCRVAATTPRSSRTQAHGSCPATDLLRARAARCQQNVSLDLPQRRHSGETRAVIPLSPSEQIAYLNKNRIPELFERLARHVLEVKPRPSSSTGFFDSLIEALQN